MNKIIALTVARRESVSGHLFLCVDEVNTVRIYAYTNIQPGGVKEAGVHSLNKTGEENRSKE